MIYKAVVQYNGINYSGFARQASGADTIQERLESSLSTYLRKDILIKTAARTDKGVNALANVISFETEEGLDLYKLSWGLNALLPEDIRITDIEAMPGFDPRNDAKARVYSYYILNRKYSSVVHRNCFLQTGDLDTEAMKKAASFIKGEDNYRSFSSKIDEGKSYHRNVEYVTVENSDDFFDVKKQDLIKINIRSDSFIYNMVRIISGTLVEVGQGKLKAEDIPGIIKSKDRTKAGFTAPPEGLFLVEVVY